MADATTGVHPGESTMQDASLPPIEPGVRFAEVADFLGYGIGDDGSTWSRRIGGPPRNRLKSHWSPLLHYVQSSGHHVVRLSRDGEVHKRLVHRLVLEAFRGPCPAGMEGCHNDGDPGNNRLDNLRWDTHRSNVHDAHKHLPSWCAKGSNHFNSVLTEADVAEIFRLRRDGWKQADIGARFSVGQPVISNILSRKTWKHVANEPAPPRLINTRT